MVGAGYSGLHAALIFVAAGLDVVVLEAGSLGYGGSGRNGGVVSAKFRRSFSNIAKVHGIDTARRMHDIAEQSVDHLVETVEKYDLHDAGFLTGFNGAGVAMSGMIGHGLATRMLGKPFELSLIEREKIEKVPFHAFRSVGVRAMTYGYELMDSLGL